LRSPAHNRLLVVTLPVALAVLPFSLLLPPDTASARAAVLAPNPHPRPALTAYVPLGWWPLTGPACVVRGPRAGRYARVCSHLLTRGLTDLKSYCAMRGLHSDRRTTAGDVRVRIEACNLWVRGRAVRGSYPRVGQGFVETATPGAYFTTCPGRWETHMGYSIRWPDSSLTAGRLLAPVTGC
jgi:hypothetical protein